MIRQFMLRRLLGLARDCAGAALAEFTVVFPVLLLSMFGIIEFSQILSDQVTLTAATAAGGRQLSISRGDTSACTDTQSQIYSAAPTLKSASMTITLTVNGTACATISNGTSCSGSNSACSTALSTAQGQSAEVSTTYPCIDLFGSGTGPYSFSPSCTLKSNLTLLVQ
jgi:Flp pilus assembly protein TadG